MATSHDSDDQVHITRRTALAVVGTASAAGMLGIGAGCESSKGTLASSAKPALNSEAHLAADLHWDTMVGQDFHVHGATYHDDHADDVTTTLVLLESRGVDHSKDPARPDDVRDESVSLLFSPKDGTHLESGTYTLENDQLGAFPMFVHHCRVDEHAGKTVYEAVLN